MMGYMLNAIGTRHKFYDEFSEYLSVLDMIIPVSFQYTFPLEIRYTFKSDFTEFKIVKRGF